MKKIVLILVCLIFSFANCETLKGGVYEEYIPKGFFGTWAVVSKLKSTNNPNRFSYESRDIWTLSGYDNVLILQNIEHGAYSQITVKEKNIEGKMLKFNRQKTIKTQNGKEIQKESVVFTLFGKNFSGSDTFTVENYDKNNKLTKTDSAIYTVEAVKISGSDSNN